MTEHMLNRLRELGGEVNSDTTNANDIMPNRLVTVNLCPPI